MSQKSVSEVTPHLVKFSALLIEAFFWYPNCRKLLFIENIYTAKQNRICTIHITFSTNCWPHSAFPTHQFQRKNMFHGKIHRIGWPRYKQERIVNPNQRPKRKILRITYLEGFGRNPGLNSSHQLMAGLEWINHVYMIDIYVK